MGNRLGLDSLKKRLFGQQFFLHLLLGLFFSLYFLAERMGALFLSLQQIPCSLEVGFHLSKSTDNTLKFFLQLLCTSMLCIVLTSIFFSGFTHRPQLRLSLLEFSERQSLLGFKLLHGLSSCDRFTHGSFGFGFQRRSLFPSLFELVHQ